MNIDCLTLGQIKEINALFFKSQEETKGIESAMIGKFCIIRTYSSGVHAGIVIAIQDKKVLLKDSYRLWSWKGTGVALSGVANGRLASGQKVDTCNPELYLSEMIECIPCTQESQESICSQAAK
jgi:hypothetical protein